MCPIPYYDIMRKSKDPTFLRYQMVRFALDHGIKPTARGFDVNRNTVRKWLRRYQKDSMGGLVDRSKAPHHPHSPINPEQKLRAIELKKRLPS